MSHQEDPPQPPALRPSLENMNVYQYKPLQSGEIRLAKLLSGQLDEPIVIELSHQLLVGHMAPKYEALSYTWGSRENPGKIQIKDAESGFIWTIKELRELGTRNRRAVAAKLAVTQNLEAALRHLRRTDESRILWIDAICIDQGNIKERSVEVHRMGGIYNWAVEVVIWLGASTPHTQSTIEMFRRIGQDVEWNYLMERPSLRNKHSDMRILEKLNEPFNCCYTVTEIEGIRDFLDRPWFTRLWMWQEVCQARTAVVLCGEHQLSRDLFSTAILCLRRQATKIDPGYPWRGLIFDVALRRITWLVREVPKLHSGEKVRFPTLLRKTEYSSCEDPKDRIYAQISLLPKPLQEKITPDYCKDKSQVYLNAFQQSSVFTGRLDLLEHCGERPLDRCLPSWVPNWAVPRKGFPLRYDFAQASSKSRSEISFENEAILVARGICNANVAEVSGQMELGCQLEDVLSVWNSWAQPKSRKREYSGPLFDAFCHTLCCGKIKERYPQERFIGLKMARDISGLSKDHIPEEHMKREQNEYKEGFENSDIALERLQLLNYERNIENNCWGRRLFTTAKGNIGLGPGNIQSGDTICILLGLDTPIALRTVGNDRFLVIGCCYVHGLMDGEGVLGPLPETWKSEYRTLKVPFGPNQKRENRAQKLNFVNLETGLRTQEDPRLWPLPPGWSSFLDEKGKFRFRDRIGGTYSSDPRLTSKELEKHGISTQVFRII